MSNVNRLQKIARQYPGFVIRCSYGVMITAFVVLLSWGVTQSYEQQLVQQQQEVYTQGLSVDKFLDATLSNVNLLRSQAEYFLESTPSIEKFDTASDYAPSKQLPRSQDFSLFVLKDADLGAVSPFFERGKGVNLQREVEMSLSLAPLLRPIHEQLSTEGRIRYTSLAALEMTYPATPPMSRIEQIKIFQNFIDKDLIAGKMPKNNHQRKTYLTHPYEDIFGKGLMVTATSPVYDQDKYLGNIGIDFKLEALNSFINQFSDKNTLLLTLNGEVLNYPVVKPTSSISTKLQHLIKNTVVRTELLKLLKTTKNNQVSIDGYVITYYKLTNAAWVIAKVTPITTLVQNILIKHLPVICGVIAGITGLLSISISVINRMFRKLNKARIAAEETNKKLQAALTQLELLASTDKLTGAWNRRHFEQIASSEMSRGLRHNQPLSILMLDIDYFKHINDKYGHQIGDAVLVQLTHILTENIRTSDVLTRWGGEEFIILTPFTSIHEATDLAQRLRLKIAKTDFSSVKNITISLGVAQFQSAENLSNFLKRADTALYQAKNSGRNTVAVAPSTLDTWIQETEKRI